MISNPVTSEKGLHFETLDIYKFRILWLQGVCWQQLDHFFPTPSHMKQPGWKMNLGLNWVCKGDLSYSNHGKQNFPNFWSSNTKFKQKLKIQTGCELEAKNNIETYPMIVYPVWLSNIPKPLVRVGQTYHFSSVFCSTTALMSRSLIHELIDQWTPGDQTWVKLSQKSHPNSLPSYCFWSCEHTRRAFRSKTLLARPARHATIFGFTKGGGLVTPVSTRCHCEKWRLRILGNCKNRWSA